MFGLTVAGQLVLSWAASMPGSRCFAMPVDRLLAEGDYRLRIDSAERRIESVYFEAVKG